MQASNYSKRSSLGMRDFFNCTDDNGNPLYSALLPHGTGDALAVIVMAPMSSSELNSIAHILTCIALAKARTEPAVLEPEEETEVEYDGG